MGVASLTEAEVATVPPPPALGPEVSVVTEVGGGAGLVVVVVPHQGAYHLLFCPFEAV